jgi:protein-disulfide isomerase
VFAVPIADAPSIGKADAPVTIVEAYEYACPACNGARQTMAGLREKYGDKIRVVYRQFIVHPDVATTAAHAVCAAHKQGKFEAMDKVLWEKGYAKGRDFSPAKLEAFATEAGLDLERFKADSNGPCRASVEAGHAELASFGQGATPTFFINGRYVVGASPVALSAVIDEELATATQRIAAGTPPADYYRTWVLEKGQKKFVAPAT